MRNDRRGMTLIELMVVIAMIGLLVGLLMPAVQMAREAARRANCLSNMRQMGIALHVYMDRHGAFPPGFVSRVLPDFDDAGPGWSWAAMILADVEQPALFNLVDFRAPIDAPENEAARTMSLPLFVCPSDPEFEPLIEIPHIKTGEIITTMAASNYVACIGTVRPTCKICRDAFDGVFGRNRPISAAEIVDGLSSTIALGERAFHWSTPALLGNLPGSMLLDRRIEGRLSAGPGYVLGTTFKDGFNIEEIVDDPREVNSLAETFGSGHPGGANFAFCDGGVRFFRDTTDPAIMNALSTRYGNPKGGDEVHANPFQQ